MFISFLNKEFEKDKRTQIFSLKVDYDEVKTKCRCGKLSLFFSLGSVSFQFSVRRLLRFWSDVHSLALVDKSLGGPH